MYLILFLFSLSLTYVVREYAIKKAIMDIPNERSSHSTPTPRGGGIAIVITFFIGLVIVKDSIDPETFYALFCVLPIVVISLIDDIHPLSSKIRLFIQAFSAFLALYFLGGVHHIDFILFEVTGWWLNIIAFISILWLTNLYNFLDGIDGYAASQAILLGLGMMFFLSNSLGLLLAVSTLGFLVFNWSKASIFMGDVGSATLGFIFAVFTFSNTSNGEIYFWLIGLSLFWFDATITLVRRYKNRENITTAHKKHMYQRLVQSGWSHQAVTIGLIIVNILLFSLLYIISAWEYLFFFNIVLLFAMMCYVDKQKKFD